MWYFVWKYWCFVVLFRAELNINIRLNVTELIIYGDIWSKNCKTSIYYILCKWHTTHIHKKNQSSVSHDPSEIIINVFTDNFDQFNASALNRSHISYIVNLTWNFDKKKIHLNLGFIVKDQKNVILFVFKLIEHNEDVFSVRKRERKTAFTNIYFHSDANECL